MERKIIGIDEVLDFGETAEPAYSDSHGIEFPGMRYGLTTAMRGWAIPGRALERGNTRRKLKQFANTLYSLDGSPNNPGETGYYCGPVTLIPCFADSYQYHTVHELAHQYFGSRLALDSKPVDGMTGVPDKIALALDEGCAEMMSIFKMDGLLDEANLRTTREMIKRYQEHLHDRDAFRKWQRRCRLKTHMTDYHHAVGLNFVVSTWEPGQSFRKYLDMIEGRLPTEDDIINPKKYLDRL